MKPKPSFCLLLLVVFSATFTSCKSTWTEKQTSQLSTIRFVASEYNGNAYRTPKAVSPELERNVDTGGGNGLIGTAVYGTVAASKHAIMKEKFGSSIAQIDGQPPKGIPGVTAATLEKRLANLSFFKDRITESGVATLHVEVREYGLQRMEGSQNFAPYITANGKLIGETGKKIWESRHTTRGRGPAQGTLEFYAEDSTRLQDHLNQVADLLSDHWATALKEKSGSTTLGLEASELSSHAYPEYQSPHQWGVHVDR